VNVSGHEQVAIGPKLSDGGWRRKAWIAERADRQPPFAGARG
jgi:hypothetical protein